MAVTLFSPKKMPHIKSSQSKKGKLSASISKKSKPSFKHLSINIEELKDGKDIGYCAEIKELNSIIMADTIEELFSLIPTMIEIEKSKHFQ